MPSKKMIRGGRNGRARDNDGRNGGAGVERKRAESDCVEYGKKVIRIEADAVAGLERRIDAGFARAVEAVAGLSPAGRVVVSGIGKPAFIGGKISATLASTGTPSHFLHPADAVHGDMGRVTKEDVVLLLSNSGESREILDLLDVLKKIGATVVAVTGRDNSTLARYSDVTLCIGDIEEACPMKLAPSATTTAMLAMGDALALAVLNQKDFGPEDYALYHPGGALGRKLMKVREVMRHGDRVALVRAVDTVRAVVVKITKARSGAAVVVDAGGKLLGIFTDGDLRRSLDGGNAVLKRAVKSVMTARPVAVREDALCAEAVKLMREKRIDELPVVDTGGKVVGVLDVQDLLAIGLV